MRKIFDIDCSQGEGGGGALRTGLALSAAANLPVILRNIRIRRKDKGMGGTHASLIKLLTQVTDAIAEGAEFGSTELRFEPQHLPKGGSYLLSFDDPPFFRPYYGEISVETDYLEGMDTLTPPIHNYQGAAFAGQAVSTYLVIVAQALVFANAAGTITARGGTDVPAAQSLEGMQDLFLSVLAKMGVHYELNIRQRGMLGIGDGVVELSYYPTSNTLSPIEIVDTHAVTVVDCYIHCFGNLMHSMEDLKSHLEASIQSVANVPVNFHTTMRTDYPKNGIEIAFMIRRGEVFPIKMELWGEGFKSIEDAARIVKERLVVELRSNAPIARFTCDQLIPVMGLATGTSRIITDRITPHVFSAIHLTEELLGVKFHHRELPSGLFEISVDGIGFSRS